MKDLTENSTALREIIILIMKIGRKIRCGDGKFYRNWTEIQRHNVIIGIFENKIRQKIFA